MQSISTIGLDIAKSVFQVHGVDAAGQVVIRRQLKRRFMLSFFERLSPCLVGIEACASSHYWSRELQALGHTVRLMPPAYATSSDPSACDPNRSSKCALDRLSRLRDHAAQGEPGRHHGRRSLAAEAWPRTI